MSASCGVLPLPIEVLQQCPRRLWIAVATRQATRESDRLLLVAEASYRRLTPHGPRTECHAKVARRVEGWYMGTFLNEIAKGAIPTFTQMSRPQLDGTALDLFARRPTRSFRTELSFLDGATTTRDGEEGGYRPRQVVELCGASDTPTTRVLEHVVVSFLMKSCKGPAQTGNERVVIFDHEYQVSALQIEALVARRLAASEQDEAVEDALSRVQICHCRDSFQWLATLNHLHFELLEAIPARTLTWIEVWRSERGSRGNHLRVRVLCNSFDASREHCWVVSCD